MRLWPMFGCCRRIARYLCAIQLTLSRWYYKSCFYCIAREGPSYYAHYTILNSSDVSPIWRASDLIRQRLSYMVIALGPCLVLE